jgi:DNA polymerase (family 10)
LKKLDVVVAAVHSKFNMTEDDMTKRIITAMETGLVNVIAHPTSRLLTWREPYPLNMEKLFETAKKYNVAMEVNSYPDRLDLNDIHCKLAKDMRLCLLSQPTHEASWTMSVRGQYCRADGLRRRCVEYKAMNEVLGYLRK